MSKYKLINNISGWAVFAVAATVYLLTIEPTASFWDCGEFITSAYKLEVGHPPGAPFFMLVGNFFTQLARDTSQVAMMVNIMSALMSAFTILFLFWTITHLTRKLLLKKSDDVLTVGQTIAVIGSGVVGALVYTFSDTFWFSAVEGEVYAFSSMLTALVFWLILKWEDNADKPHSDKWLVLIAYVMGLSIGVHLLNLLCIPAIVMVYYFKKTENANWKGALKALLVSFVLIIIVMWGVIPGFTKVGGWFELLFVNTLGLPYNSGVLFYLLVLVASIVMGLYHTISSKKNENRARTAFFMTLALTGVLFINGSTWLWIVLIAAGAYFVFKSKKISMRFINLSVSCIMVILVGFSAYALIPIRSSANPPLDLNSPEDIFSLGSYLNREQYGQTPLIHGTTYASKIARNADGTAITDGERISYKQVVKASPDEKDRYEKVISPNYKYTNTMLFPRMHSNPNNPSFQNHIIGYERWGGVNDRNTKPTFFQNLKYMFGYQFNYMYWRYFFWNFSGRQNDIQGDGGITAGNWITGISFIDEHVLGLGPQDEMAPDIVNNKGRNKYYMLPLILGIIGILYQLRLKERGLQSFIVVFLLFFMTGLAIILYLNQTFMEPRERDYAYAGSFYAFSIWVGMGVAGIALFLRKYIKNTKAATALASAACLFVPVQMASENWDDHDRSGRTLARDTGMNYLSSVGENAILFTNGDNDTYPLWYVQETEGFRTDVRVTNLSFLQTEWYIDQLVRPAYESEPLPIKWSRPRYSGDEGSAAFVITKKEIESVLSQSQIPAISYNNYYDTNAYRDTISLKQTMENLRTGVNSKPSNPFNTGDTQVIPGNRLYLDVDSSAVNWDALAAKPTDRMIISLEGKQAVYRHELMMLELLTNINDDNWERPLHFATTITPSLYMNLQENNFSLNGLTYQVVPGSPLNNGVNLEAAYDNMVNKFRWGGLENNPDIYMDQTSRRMLSTFRLYFTQLIDELINAGENEKALTALDKVTSMIPDSAVSYGTDGLLFARAYYRIGEQEKAEALITDIHNRINANLNWFERLKSIQIANTMSDIIYNNISPLMLVKNIYQQYDKEKYMLLTDDLFKRAQAFYMKGIPYVGDTILREITDSSVRGYYSASADDTTRQAEEEGIMQRAMEMMEQFNPRLLEQYNSVPQ
ncbi:MAG: DUF2723 domain-containing protein [Fermentimonas sp.]|nr:DUF2723 domain-containing protein [Fermentimonas sp.]MDD2930880.1 DUF2723 domain-containing protein [Fermentimonas sp.]MDD3188386.1 DUF2723 domain-containing protein [Fermentimonas sp.]MDD4283787.1 DUF2723 domain-containing protein [Fermentimonas sp.]MDD4723185.1 DUF2723 domain-containing protein [Fermentimonas sp.]